MIKFLRKILVLGLVFALSIPSFAAVSVSDGSAFVSKAEFSASLNNLSSRMSNLENSLDAKIDSLVSSYLSRNGIWNGEKQTIAISSTTTVFDGLSSYRCYYKPSQKEAGGWYSNEKEVISNCSKSGLIFLYCYINTEHSLYSRTSVIDHYTTAPSVALVNKNFIDKYNNKYAKTLYDSYGSYWFAMTVADAVSVALLTTTTIQLISSSNINYDITQEYYEPCSILLNGFVNKGETYYISFLASNYASLAISYPQLFVSSATVY